MVEVDEHPFSVRDSQQFPPVVVEILVDCSDRGCYQLIENFEDQQRQVGRKDERRDQPEDLRCQEKIG